MTFNFYNTSGVDVQVQVDLIRDDHHRVATLTHTFVEGKYSTYLVLSYHYEYLSEIGESINLESTDHVRPPNKINIRRHFAFMLANYRRSHVTHGIVFLVVQPSHTHE